MAESRMSEAELNEINRRMMEGQNTREIARHFGVTHSALERRILSAGFRIARVTKLVANTPQFSLAPVEPAEAAVV